MRSGVPTRGGLDRHGHSESGVRSGSLNIGSGKSSSPIDRQLFGENHPKVSYQALSHVPV